jgi:hypothetical protein
LYVLWSCKKEYAAKNRKFGANDNENHLSAEKQRDRSSVFTKKKSKIYICNANGYKNKQKWISSVLKETEEKNDRF